MNRRNGFNETVAVTTVLEMFGKSVLPTQLCIELQNNIKSLKVRVHELHVVMYTVIVLN